MMRIPLTVHYRDGTSKDVSATQYAVSAFAVYAAKSGLVIKNPQDPGMLGIVQLRYMAYAELQRDAPQGKRLGFDSWSLTVDEVTGPEQPPEPPDPTRPATSAG